MNLLMDGKAQRKIRGENSCGLFIGWVKLKSKPQSLRPIYLEPFPGFSGELNPGFSGELECAIWDEGLGIL